MYEKLVSIAGGLNIRFEDGDNPFRIATRLMEECGELAAEINHFEGCGIKREKHGEPNVAHLAKEVQDVIRVALQVALHYQIIDELQDSIEQSYQAMVEEGLIE